MEVQYLPLASSQSVNSNFNFIHHSGTQIASTRQENQLGRITELRLRFYQI
jgi:hypothetical protein